MPKSMTHLNHHLLCATDCETSGLQPGYHEVVQVCFVPLDENLEPADLPIFDVYIKPEHPQRFDSPHRQAFDRAVQDGFDRFVAADLFEQWFGSLKLPESKRIVMLAHNGHFESTFYREWLGYEHFNYFFDGRTRDLLTVAQFMNDWADFNTDGEYPFPRSTSLNSVAQRLGVEVEEGLLHDAAYDSYITAKAYKRALHFFHSGALNG